MEVMISRIFADSVKLYALMTPPAVLSAFLAYTRGYDRPHKFSVAVKTSLAMFVIGLSLYLFGSSIFELFGFTLDAFRIGTGTLLMLTAISLMNDDGESAPQKTTGDFSIVPLAIPLGMGPASIGAVMVMGASADGLGETVAGVFSLFIAATSMLLLLCMAGPVARALRATGIAVLAKLTGLLLAALAAQVVFTGVQGFIR